MFIYEVSFAQNSGENILFRLSRNVSEQYVYIQEREKKKF